jgi:hypothetical protein
LSRRTLGAAVSLALFTGLLIAAAPSVSAATPAAVASLFPNESHAETSHMSDAPDGVSTLPGARFTALSDPGATQVSWYACAPGVATETNAPTGCNFIGTDTSGIQTESGGDEGYDVLKEFDATWEGDWDVVVQACEGSVSSDGVDEGTLADNCVQDIERGIRFDDGETGGREFPTGEAVATCEQASCLQPPAYVAPSSNGEVTYNATGGAAVYTSLDTQDISMCFDLDVGPTTDEFECDTFATGALFPFETTETWKRGAAFVDFPDNSDWALIAYAVSDTYTCETDLVTADPEIDATTACVIAITYGRSTSADPAVAIGSFITDGHTCMDEGETNARVARPADEYEVLTEGDARELVGCLQKPAGDTYITDRQVTWESSGPGELSTCEGTLSDSDGDGRNDRCVIPAAGDDRVYSAGTSNTDYTDGTQTLTVCDDPEGNGCGDATVWDAITAVWLGDDVPATQCNDGIDNDGDGNVDSADAGCSDALDDSEDSDQPTTADTSVTVKYVKAKKLFKGAVSSDESACVSAAKVTIKKKGGSKLGTATANDAGAYKLKKQAGKGTYIASVKARAVDGVECSASKATTKVT